MVCANLMKLSRAFGGNMSDEDICKAANSRPGLYRRCGEVVNFFLSPKVLALPNKKGAVPYGCCSHFETAPDPWLISAAKPTSSVCRDWIDATFRQVLRQPPSPEGEGFW